MGDIDRGRDIIESQYISNQKDELLNMVRTRKNVNVVLLGSILLCVIHTSYIIEKVAAIYIVSPITIITLLEEFGSRRESLILGVEHYALRFEDLEFKDWLNNNKMMESDLDTQSALVDVIKYTAQEFLMLKVIERLHHQGEQLCYIRLVPAFIRLMNLYSEHVLSMIFGISESKVDVWKKLTISLS